MMGVVERDGRDDNYGSARMELIVMGFLGNVESDGCSGKI